MEKKIRKNGMDECEYEGSDHLLQDVCSRWLCRCQQKVATNMFMAFSSYSSSVWVANDGGGCVWRERDKI